MTGSKQTYINSFKGTFLSNMHPCIIYFENIRYESTEAAYQAQKTDDIAIRKQFININGYQAKKLGQLLHLRDGWKDMKIPLMEEILLRKFTSRSSLAAKLIATGDSVLTEGVYWHDNFWGHCICKKCNNKEKHNHLGKLLMKIRTQLQNAT